MSKLQFRKVQPPATESHQTHSIAREGLLRKETVSTAKRFNWHAYFANGEVYKGVAIKQDTDCIIGKYPDIWWGWDGLVLHQSNTRENLMRAIDLNG